MGWLRLGRIYRPELRDDWICSHGANPCAEHLDGDRFRVYFSPRDRDSRSSVAVLELDLSTLEVAAASCQKVLGPGDPGAFDDRGASMGCVVRQGNVRFLYYLGWSLPGTMPWRTSIGLALSRDGSPFERFGSGLIMGPDSCDPLSLSYPWVLRDGDAWRMWYGSHVSWREGGEHEHLIKYAESEDGIHWRRPGNICFEAQQQDSSAYSRPCVLLQDNVYRMWFSFRGRHYRIGYAESGDAIKWLRMDEVAGLDPEGTGWESESVEYAHVFDHKGRRYALYCGNGYGATGFGLAVEQ